MFFGCLREVKPDTSPDDDEHYGGEIRFIGNHLIPLDQRTAKEITSPSDNDRPNKCSNGIVRTEVPKTVFTQSDCKRDQCFEAVDEFFDHNNP